MRLGIAAYSYRDALTDGTMDLEDLIDLAAELDCDGVELTAYYFPSTEPAYLHQLKRYALTRGIHVAGAAMGSRFTVPDEERRSEQVAGVRHWLDCAVELGAPYLRVFGGNIPEGCSEAEARGWTVEALKKCAEYAEKRGVVLALENHHGITSTADQVLALVKAVDSPWLGVNLDTGNYRQDPFDEIRRTVPHAVAAHVKTVYWPGGEKQPVDLDGLLTTLQDAGYRGYLNIEYEAEEPAEEAVPTFARRLRDRLDALDQGAGAT